MVKQNVGPPTLFSLTLFYRAKLYVFLLSKNRSGITFVWLPFELMWKPAKNNNSSFNINKSNFPILSKFGLGWKQG